MHAEWDGCGCSVMRALTAAFVRDRVERRHTGRGLGEALPQRGGLQHLHLRPQAQELAVRGLFVWMVAGGGVCAVTGPGAWPS
jgi:hypothetical protein